MIREIELCHKGFKMKNFCVYLSKNGLFRFRTNFLFSALLRVPEEEINCLEKLEEKIELHLPMKIPYGDVKRIEKFLKKIAEIYGTEGLIIPQFHPEKQIYKFFVPHQTAGPGFVTSEEPIIERDGFFPIGTIHSHAFCSAFHSPGDIQDEAQNFSGIHMTAGRLDLENPEWVATLVVNGRRIKLNPADVLELEADSPPEWFQKICLDVHAERVCGLRK